MQLRRETKRWIALGSQHYWLSLFGDFQLSATTMQQPDTRGHLNGDESKRRHQFRRQFPLVVIPTLAQGNSDMSFVGLSCRNLASGPSTTERFHRYCTNLAVSPGVIG